MSFLNSMKLKSETLQDLLAMPFSTLNLAKLPSQGSTSKSMIYKTNLTRITGIFHKSLDSTELRAAFGVFLSHITVHETIKFHKNVYSYIFASYNTIHNFKYYFVIIFSVINFQFLVNKQYSNRL